MAKDQFEVIILDVICRTKIWFVIKKKENLALSEYTQELIVFSAISSVDFLKAANKTGAKIKLAPTCLFKI